MRLGSIGCEVLPEKVRRWEIGVTEPRAAELFTVARLLQVPPYKLMLDGVPPGGEPE